MRAFNLIPAEQRSGGASLGAGRSQGAAYAVLGVLGVLAVFALLYGTAHHQVSSRQAQVASLTVQVQQAQAQAAQLAPYTSFAALREQRTKAVSDLVDSRFDWAHAVHELGRVLPHGTSIASLTGTIGAAATASAAPAPAAPAAPGAATAAAVASATPPGSVPQFTLSGCATSQSEVALTLNRLRLIDGVSEVTLQSSTKGRWQRWLGRVLWPRPGLRRAGRLRSAAAGIGPQLPAQDRVGEELLDRAAHDTDWRLAMTGRDRIVLIVFASLAVLAAVWLLVVSPERKRATGLATQVSAAQAQLATAESAVASARGAQARYTAEYASVVSLGKAVPPSQEVSSLIYQLDQASNQKQVEFNSITSGGGSSASPASAAAAATPGAALAGFTQMPFTFVFNGSFLDLYHLFQQLNHYTLRTASGSLEVSGRLLTIQSLKLAPGTGAEQGPAKPVARAPNNSPARSRPPPTCCPPRKG